MKKFLFCVLLISAANMLFAQSNYNKALGVKFPVGVSVTYKKFVSDTRNIEGMITIGNKGYRMTGLYEFNFYSFRNVENLSWFVGPGVHLGFWKDAYKSDYSSKADLGIDGIIGLDYKLKNFPLNFSVDWQPSITLAGSAGVTPAYGGVAVRYTF